jgi:hypothetical protein
MGRGIGKQVGLALLAALASALVGGCGGDSKTTTVTSAANAGLAAAAAPASEAGAPDEYSSGGPLLVDSGFRPGVDGFSFENYGPGYQDLTASEMVALFGPKVCSSGSATECVLTPPAQSWMAASNRGMGGGHCFGFSVTSLMMFERSLDPLDFGAPLTFQLGLEQNVALQSQLAEAMAVQGSPRVLRSTLTGPPTAVLRFLQEKLAEKDETYTIGIFDSAAADAVGHAVTPYGIEDRGHGHFAVLIYDNNYPGITRAIDIDTHRDTWSYETAPNPDVGSYLFQGKGSVNTIRLIPTGSTYGVQPCPFCRKSGGRSRFNSDGATSAGLRQLNALPAGTYDEVSLLGDPINHGHLVLTDSEGNTTGIVDGELVNEIPGVRLVTPLSAQNFKQTPEPIYQVPDSVHYTITLDGSDLEAPDTETVSIVGPGYSATAGEIDLEPGQRIELELGADGTSLTYEAGPGEAQAAQLQIGIEQPGGGDYRFTVATPPIESGSAVTAAADPDDGSVMVDAGDVDSTGRYGLTVEQLRPSGADPSDGRAVRIEGGDSAQVTLDP